MKPILPKPISLRSPKSPNWQQEYERERAKFQAETLRASNLHEECVRLRAKIASRADLPEKIMDNPTTPAAVPVDLPPLPAPSFWVQGEYTAGQMKDYAIAAIEKDRATRSEPAAEDHIVYHPDGYVILPIERLRELERAALTPAAVAQPSAAELVRDLRAAAGNPPLPPAGAGEATEPSACVMCGALVEDQAVHQAVPVENPDEYRCNDPDCVVCNPKTDIVHPAVSPSSFPDAADVRPDAESKVRMLLWDDFPECCGCPVVGAQYMGSTEMVCCGNPEPALLNDKQIVASLREMFPAAPSPKDTP